jgi:hypothetical protein
MHAEQGLLLAISVLILCFSVLGPRGGTTLALTAAYAALIGCYALIVTWPNMRFAKPKLEPRAMGGAVVHNFVQTVQKQKKALSSMDRHIARAEQALNELNAISRLADSESVARVAPKPPLAQVAGVEAQMPAQMPAEADDALTSAEIAEKINTNLFRGSCPGFIQKLGEIPELFNTLNRVGTQANLNENQAQITREWDPYTLYNRRTRLETALAMDLVTYNRNENNRMKDFNLKPITAEEAARILSSEDAAPAEEPRLEIGPIS